MTVEPTVVVLPAFQGLSGAPIDGELGPWESAYDFERRRVIDGLAYPFRYDPCGIGVVPTGIGKTAAATTTAALCATDEIRLHDSLIISVGIAGAPPSLPIGSVVVADSIVDWDDKCRFDPTDGEPVAIEPNPYTETHGVFDLDPQLVSWAESMSEETQLDGLSGSPVPTVTVGTNVCADELWHGVELAEQVNDFVQQRERGQYVATEMEDIGTAAALERFGLADQYLSIRGVSNHDRPEAGESARRSFFYEESGPPAEIAFQKGLENAVRIAQGLISERLAE